MNAPITQPHLSVEIPRSSCANHTAMRRRFCTGTYVQLTDCLLFASWIFYGLVASSVFVLRRKL
ncbi:MAG: hypothetical protein ACREXT_12560, partial [Gammaproteobacteria bacterium]